ncbi:aspartate 1-decarboxylase [bacterium (candidate division B38) B3_B38]|nr:MAG: aspartate 1-decarboxylase [bacterium (candidate division B38) B3_B38]
MQRVFLKGKIHQATVTESNLHYEGSLTVDRELMEAAGMLPYEKVEVYNITNGNRFSTYLIEGERGSGVIAVNGAAARLAQPGDLIIVTSYAMIDDHELPEHKPKIVLFDSHNKVKRVIS